MRNDIMRTALRTTKALADRQRLRALMLLRPGELCVCQIVEVLGLAPSTVSKHLSLLHDAGLVICRKQGRWAHYRLPRGAAAAPVKPLLAWLQQALENDQEIMQDARKLRAVTACDPGQLCRKQRLRP